MVAFLQKNGWVLPLIFALLLGVVGSLSYRRLEASAKQEIGHELRIVRDTSAERDPDLGGRRSAPRPRCTPPTTGWWSTRGS